ncbi:MAG: hypothetical protein HQK49_09615 [Oligoflexia bacterium]|nr:hypothetical protein [Oligoflexia bacterium]
MKNTKLKLFVFLTSFNFIFTNLIFTFTLTFVLILNSNLWSQSNFHDHLNLIPSPEDFIKNDNFFEIIKTQIPFYDFCNIKQGKKSTSEVSKFCNDIINYKEIDWAKNKFDETKKMIIDHLQDNKPNKSNQSHECNGNIKRLEKTIFKQEKFHDSIQRLNKTINNIKKACFENKDMKEIKEIKLPQYLNDLKYDNTILKKIIIKLLSFNNISSNNQTNNTSNSSYSIQNVNAKKNSIEQLEYLRAETLRSKIFHKMMDEKSKDGPRIVVDFFTEIFKKNSGKHLITVPQDLYGLLSENKSNFPNVNFLYGVPRKNITEIDPDNQKEVMKKHPKIDYTHIDITGSISGSKVNIDIIEKILKNSIKKVTSSPKDEQIIRLHAFEDSNESKKVVEGFYKILDNFPCYDENSKDKSSKINKCIEITKAIASEKDNKKSSFTIVIGHINNVDIVKISKIIPRECRVFFEFNANLESNICLQGAKPKDLLNKMYNLINLGFKVNRGYDGIGLWNGKGCSNLKDYDDFINILLDSNNEFHSIEKIECSVKDFRSLNKSPQILTDNVFKIIDLIE